MKQLSRSNAFLYCICPSRTAGQRWKRAGLTVLEVLFSMGIILVGLVGIAAMVPFAGRQASESYKISHGLASGANTISMFQSDHFIVPRIERPWQLVDDEYPKTSPNSFRSRWPAQLPSTAEWNLGTPMGATNNTYFSSFERLYDGSQARSSSLYRYHIDKVFGETGNVGSLNVRQKIALAQNRALGQSFCIDPLFYAEQLNVPNFNQSPTKIMRGDWGNFRRNRFPYYDENFPVSLNPFDYPRSGEFTTPRLFRISYRDSSLPISSSHISDPVKSVLYLDKSWLRGDAAKMASTMESRDLVSEKSTEVGVPFRQFNALAGATTFNDVIKSVDSGNLISWLATVVPSDGTTMVNPLSIDASNPGFLQGMDFFPESYDVSVVVFGKRNVNELTTTALQGNNYAAFRSANVLPSSERLAKVTELSADSGRSGTFEVVLGSYNSPTVNALPDDPTTVSAKIVVGDWIMLSRYTYDDPLTTNVSNTFPIREIHRWYRVVGVTGENIFPRRIRVAGSPWDWSVHELEAMKRLARTNPSLVIPSGVDPTIFPTVATLVSDVVAVYQRTLQVKK